MAPLSNQTVGNGRQSHAEKPSPHPLPRGRGRRSERRGVLLLLILSLLVLFAVIAVTFALVASQYRRSSLVGPRTEQYTTNCRDQLDDALLQVLRGSKNPLSVLSIHSLLEDMYGNDGLQGTVGPNNSMFINAAAGQPGQLIDIYLNGPLPWPLAGYYGMASPYGPTAPSGYFNGCVLSMTSGSLAGKSARIVGYDSGTAINSFTSNQAILRVVAFEGATTSNLPQSGDAFLINGRPFNGTGFGFNPTTGLVNAKDSSNTFLQALLPNPVSFGSGSNYTVAGGIGGSDEDYDAADWNNMLLGLVDNPNKRSTNIKPYPSLHQTGAFQILG